jgi:hypothetical protein
MRVLYIGGTGEISFPPSKDAFDPATDRLLDRIVSEQRRLGG